MALPVTLAELKANIGTPIGLDDPSLTRIANGVWDEITSRFGQPTGRVEEYDARNAGRYLVLNRKASSVSLVRERSGLGDVWATVASTDYSIMDGGNTLRRHDRSFQRWVEVTYDTADAGVYIAVFLDLTAIRLPQQGWRSRSESPEDAWGNPTEGGAVTGLRGSLQVAGSAKAAADLEAAIFARLHSRRIGVA